MSTRAAIALLCVGLCGPAIPDLALAAPAADASAAPVTHDPVAPQLDPVTSLEVGDAVRWTVKTDTGLLAVYADGAVHVFDLLDGGKRVGTPIHLPGAGKRAGAVHLSGTNLLLIASVDGAPQEGDATDAVPPTKSCVINLATGKVLWYAESFAPPVQTFLFPKDGALVVRSGREGNEFAAYEVATGRRLWSSALSARYAGRRGDLLEVLGEDSGLIDPATGKRRWTFSLPSGRRHPVLVFPAHDRLVVWKGNDFEGFVVPAPGAPGADLPPADSAEPPDTVAAGTAEPVDMVAVPGTAEPANTVEPRSIWKFAAEDSMPARCIFMGSCWAQVVGEDRLLVVSKRHAQMVNAATGKVVWSRRKDGAWRTFPISPSGKTGVEVGWGDLAFIDVASGEETFRIDAAAPVDGKEGVHTAQWLDDNQLLVVYYDNWWRPRDMARYDVAGRKLLWSAALPRPAKYRLTGKQKGGIAGAVIGTVALVAIAVAAAPAAAYPYQPVYFPCCVPLAVAGPLAAKLPRDNPMADDEGGEAAVRTAARPGLPEGILALDRRRERWKRIREADASELFVLSGEDDAYSLFAVDLASGTRRTVSEYRQTKVHSMDFDVASRLVISIEDQKRLLRLLAAPDRRGATGGP